MKKYLLSFVFLIVVGSSLTFNTGSTAQVVADAEMVSANIVISQIYGGGGNGATSQYQNDFVELFNRGASPVSLNGWSTQYASATGTNWLVTPLSNVTLQPGQYYLIQYIAGTTVTGLPALPTPDLVAPVVIPEGFIPNLSGTTGKLALVNSTVKLPASVCPSDLSIVDLLGYGGSASCFEGVKTLDLSNTTVAIRNGGGCVDTDNNNADFTTTAGPTPRNTASSTNSCNLGGSLQAGINANPNTVSPLGNTLLTVPVIPATTPPSTGITVVGNLSDIGLAASQPFFDNGTNGDVTAGDNTFSYLATIPAGSAGGVRNVTAVATDAQARSVNLNVSITINAPLPGDDPLIFGNPSNATGDIANQNNYLMLKPQYSLSYNRSKATPNWTAWRLDSSWIGSTPRQDDFRPDPALPAGWFQVQDNSYSGSGYDRGHMCPSGDRTNSVPNNSATFLMTNMVPQLAANNQGPWEDFETYCRTLASQGNEIYIISGVSGNIGTIAAGQIVIPRQTWKVVIVLPNGTNDVSRVTRGTRAFGIIVPNFPPLNINDPWRPYRVTVDAIEILTGYDFFSAIPKNTQELIERKRDRL